MTMKSVFTLDGKYPIDKVLETMTDIKTRTEWEEQILESQYIHKYSDAFVTYRVLFKMPIISDREFIEKALIFQSGDSHYIYNSSIPNEYCKEKSGCVRGFNMFSVTRIRKANNKILVETVNQRDLQSSMLNFLGLGTIGKSAAETIQRFKENLINRLNKILDI